MDCNSLLIRIYGGLYNRKYIPSLVLSPLRFIIRRIANIIIPKLLQQEVLRNDTHIREGGKIIVTLTSFPKRIKNVWLVIESMQRQTVRPDKILLWLSKEQFNRIEDLPNSIISRISNVFEVRLVEGDLRSHKKYCYAFKEFPNDYVITIDDDIFYPPYMIEELLSGRENNPKTVVGRYCLVMKYNEDKSLKPYNEWDEDYEVKQPNSFFGSGGGTLFVPSELYIDTTNSELACRLTPLADDVWLNAMVRLAGRKVIIITKELLLPILTKNDQRLTQANVYDSLNDQQIKDVINYYVKNLGVNPFRKNDN